jgi:hypothetical protein
MPAFTMFYRFRMPFNKKRPAVYISILSARIQLIAATFKGPPNMYSITRTVIAMEPWQCIACQAKAKKAKHEIDIYTKIQL